MIVDDFIHHGGIVMASFCIERNPIKLFQIDTTWNTPVYISNNAGASVLELFLGCNPTISPHYVTIVKVWGNNSTVQKVAGTLWDDLFDFPNDVQSRKSFFPHMVDVITPRKVFIYNDSKIFKKIYRSELRPINFNNALRAHGRVYTSLPIFTINRILIYKYSRHS